MKASRRGPQSNTDQGLFCVTEEQIATLFYPNPTNPAEVDGPVTKAAWKVARTHSEHYADQRELVGRALETVWEQIEKGKIFGADIKNPVGLAIRVAENAVEWAAPHLRATKAVEILVAQVDDKPGDDPQPGMDDDGHGLAFEVAPPLKGNCLICGLVSTATARVKGEPLCGWCRFWIMASEARQKAREDKFDRPRQGRRPDRREWKDPVGNLGTNRGDGRKTVKVRNLWIDRFVHEMDPKLKPYWIMCHGYGSVPMLADENGKMDEAAIRHLMGLMRVSRKTVWRRLKAAQENIEAVGNRYGGFTQVQRSVFALGNTVPVEMTEDEAAERMANLMIAESGTSR